MGIIEHLHEHPPRYGPEWGSGGVFGLKYYRDILYYTLAFEAEAYFIDEDGLRNKYFYEQVGSPPASGGDTYNAVEVVDDKIYFGGWVHAPAVYRGRSGGWATIDFRNKYSHVHEYDLTNNSVKLLWKETMNDPEKWVGEISEIVYDPYNDRLLLARADGYVNLGVYALDPRKGVVDRLLDKPALKGSLILDYACFAIHQYPHGLGGLECIDLIENKGFVDNIVNKAIDGDEIIHPQVGSTAQLMGRYLVFTKGGVLAGDIVDHDYRFYRLMDIPYSSYGPLRCNAKVVGGGVLVAYNSFVHAVMKPLSVEEKRIKTFMNTINAPSTLLYITPPTIKIVGVFGARITSIETIGDKILLATNNMANTGRYDASPYDQGVRSFYVMGMDRLMDKPAPVSITIPGWMVGDKTFGGIPLTGYTDPRIIMYLKKENTLHINEYQLLYDHVYRSVQEVNVGRNTISLREYSGIVSFKFDKPLDNDEYVVIDLK